MYFFMHMQIINGVLTGMNAGTAVYYQGVNSAK